MKHALLLWAGLALGAAAQAAPQLDPALRAALQSRVDSGELAGVVVGLIDGEDSAVYGIAKAGTPTPDARTVYEIGSLSKTFTGLLLAQAAAAGQVRLEQPVAELLPGYTVPDYQGAPITLLDLATQSSGLPRLPANLKPARMEDPYADYGVAELKAFLGGYQLPRAPGTQYEYSNLGYGLLGQALAQQAGLSYAELVRQRIAVPLGMASTGVALTPAMRERLAPGHDAQGRAAPGWNMNALAGAGALHSDTGDLLRYLRAMMAAAGKDGPMALAQQPRREAGAAGRIALAWHVTPVRGVPVVWHNGMTGGYASFAGYTADGRRGVVVLANSAVSLDAVAVAALLPAPTSR
ncbi:serine hydrolase domain-containing protein [Oxalobacteraceae bacterium A2-2]